MKRTIGSPLVALGLLLTVAARADFYVDPKLLEASGVAAARPTGVVQVFGVSDESQKRGAEIAQALAEWNAAWQALDAANKRLSALLNAGLVLQPGADGIQQQVSQALDMQPPALPTPVVSMGVHVPAIAPSPPSAQSSAAPDSATLVEQLFVIGPGRESGPALKLRPGEYSRAEFLAAVLPKSFKSAFVGSGQPFNKVIVTGPPRPWEQWLVSSSAQTQTAFTVSYKNRLVVYSGQ